MSSKKQFDAVFDNMLNYFLQSFLMAASKNKSLFWNQVS